MAAAPTTVTIIIIKSYLARWRPLRRGMHWLWYVVRIVVQIELGELIKELLSHMGNFFLFFSRSYT